MTISLVKVSIITALIWDDTTKKRCLMIHLYYLPSSRALLKLLRACRLSLILWLINAKSACSFAVEESWQLRVWLFQGSLKKLLLCTGSGLHLRPKTPYLPGSMKSTNNIVCKWERWVKRLHNKVEPLPKQLLVRKPLWYGPDTPASQIKNSTR